MQPRSSQPLELSHRQISNKNNRVSSEEYQRNGERMKNLHKQLSEVFGPILTAMKLAGQYVGESAVPEDNKHRTFYMSRFYSTLVVLGQWILFTASAISLCYIGFSSKDVFFFLLVCTIWQLQCASSTTICLVYLSLGQNRRSRFARFLSNFAETIPEIDSTRGKAAKGLMIAFSAGAINSVVLGIFNVHFNGVISVFPPWNGHTIARVIEFVFSTYCSFAWTLPALIFCVTCMLLEKLFTKLQDELSDRTARNFSISHLRQEHLKLCEVVHLANATFSTFLLVMVVLDIPLLCVNFYQLTKVSSETKFIKVIGFFYWCFALSSQLAVVFVFGSRVNEKAHSFYETIQKSQIVIEDIKENAELTLFLAHLRGEPIGLSVGGLAVVSKSLFLTLFGIIASYFVVLLTLPS